MRKEDREKIRTGEKDILHPDFTESRGEIMEPERISGAEVLPESIEFEGLPDGVPEMVESAIYDFCNYECSPPVEDLAKARQTRWSACCMYIGRKVFKAKGIIRKAEREEGGEWLPIDMDIINAIIPLWLFYCSKFEKTPLKADFVYFSGVSLSWLYDKQVERLTPARIEILQKLNELQENGIKSIITDGKTNPTGNIVILNHDHGYATQSFVIQNDTQKALSASSLPLLGQNK